MDPAHQSRVIPGVKEALSTQDGHGPPYEAREPAPHLSPAIQHTALFFFTLAALALSLYLAFLAWQKHRFRPIATLYKLEGYQYSRLNQNELEVDSVVFYSDPLDENHPHSRPLTEDELCKPATLHLTDSDNLITISTSRNSSSHFVSNPSALNMGNSNTAPATLPLDNNTEMSDEDLLQ